MQKSRTWFFHQAYLSSCLQLFSFCLIGSGPLSSSISLYQISSLCLLQCLCKNLLFLSQMQNCLCPYSIAWPFFNTYAAYINGGTHTLTSCLCRIFLVHGWSRFFLWLQQIPLLKGDTYLLKFGFITILTYFSRLVTNLISLWFEKRISL